MTDLPSVEDLLAATADLSHRDRMARTAALAREHAGTPELSDLLERLRTGRHGPLALHMAIAARDTAAFAAVLSGPDQESRRRALLRTWPGVGDDALAAAVDDAASAVRRELYLTLFHTRREALADRLLPAVRRDHGDFEAAALLPACSARTVAARLPDLAYAVRARGRLARRHPGILLDHMRAFRDAPPPGLVWPRDVLPLLAALDPIAPGALLDLLGPLRDPELLAELPRVRDLGEESSAVPRYPEAFPRLFDHTRAERELLDAIAHDPTEALRVLTAMPRPLAATYLKRLTGHGTALLPFLDLLPPARAEAEAERILAVLADRRERGTTAGDPHADLDAAAFLPRARAREILDRAADAGDPERRARALTRLMEAAARTGDPALLAEVASARTNRARAERDQVRAALLAGLTRVPVPLLAAAAGFDAVGPDAGTSFPHALLDDTATTPDTSTATRVALRVLAARLLTHPDTRDLPRARAWAVEVQARLIEVFGERGLQVHVHKELRGLAAGRLREPDTLLPPLERILPPGLEHALYARIAPHTAAAGARRDTAPALLLARQLGARAHDLPRLQDALRAIILADPRSSDAGRAARLHLNGVPARRTPSGPGDEGTAADPTDGRDEVLRRALALFAADPATVLTEPVWAVLADRAAPGVVSGALDVIVRAAAEDGHRWAEFPRWTTRTWPGHLVDRLADRLTVLASDPDRPVYERADLVHRLARLPGTADRLAALSERETSTELRPYLVGALGRVDTPERAVTALEGLLHGPHAHLAVRALTRHAAYLPPSRSRPLIARLLTGPGAIIARKEAARLAVAHRPPGVVDDLLRALADTDLHRDARAAVVGALTRLTDGAPDVVERLAARVPEFDAPEIRREALAVEPLDLPPAHRTAFARFVIALPDLADADPALMTARARWYPWCPDLVDDTVAAVTDLARPFGRTLPVLSALLDSGSIDGRLPALLIALADADAADATSRPIPVRPRVREPHETFQRRISTLAWSVHRRLERSTGARRSSLARGIAPVIDRLGDRPEHLEHVVRLTEASLVEDDPDGALASAEALIGILARHPLYTMVHLDPVTRTVLRAWAPEPASAPIEARVRDLVARSRQRGDHRGVLDGLVAVGAVGMRGWLEGWVEPWPGLLVEAGESPHAAVRERARLTAVS
ncbi:hypothetical protein PWG71_03820 [Nocardiopsis sp. N85]|uniref:hypothetical protein n=1 Tax=Nocardiopsis sp. N85 TaxID=3029400 RepID=UPI00237F1539|nr:hypothetical protein [Nocardiopsis sp. N85]MDE3720503.1 hypothetical protein [Nocardiopsis sp. N85]